MIKPPRDINQIPAGPASSPTTQNVLSSYGGIKPPRDISASTVLAPKIETPKIEPIVPEKKKSIFNRYSEWANKTGDKIVDFEVDLWKKVASDETVQGIAKSWKDAFTYKAPEGTSAFPIGGTVKELGGAFTSMGSGIVDFVTKQIPKTVATIEKGAIESIPLKEGGVFDKARDFLVSGYNIQIGDIQKREQARAEKMKDLPITDPQKLGYGIGSGLASIGTSVAIGVAGKSKWGASLILSALDGSDTYNRARENLIAKKEEELGRDLTEEEKTLESAKAYGEMLVDSAGIAVLEKVGLDWLLSSRGIWHKAVLETVQETMQTFYSNLVEKYGDNKAKDLTDGIVETIITTLPVGIISSGGLQLLDSKLQEQGLDPNESQELINRVQARQEEEEMKLKKELDDAVVQENIPPEQKGTIDALAQDINENVQNGLSKEQIATDLAQETGISAGKALNIINNVTKEDSVLSPIDVNSIVEEIKSEMEQDISPQEISPTAETDIVNQIDEIMSGKKNEIVSEVKTLIENGRSEGKTELEIIKDLQKSNNLSLDEAVAEMKNYPIEEKPIKKPQVEKEQPTPAKEAPEEKRDTQSTLDYDSLLNEKIKIKNKIQVLEKSGVKGDINDQNTPKGKELRRLKQDLNFTEDAMGIIRQERATKNEEIVSAKRSSAEEKLAKIDKEVNKTDLKSEYFVNGQVGFEKNVKKQNQLIDKTIEQAKEYNKAYEEVKTLDIVEKNYKKIFTKYKTILDLVKNGQTSKGVKLSDSEIKDLKKMARDYEVRLGRLERQYKITRPEQVDNGLTIEKPKETQKDKVKNAVKEKPKTIKQIAEETKIKEPNIRRILGVGAKEGTFERIEEGVYVLSKNGQDLAWIEAGNSIEVLPRLIKEGKKFDMIYSDLPYESGGNIGGNRPLGYVAITPEIYKTIVENYVKLSRDENTPIIHIMTTGKSSVKQATQYNNAILNNPDLKLVAIGSYVKLRPSGEVSNMGKYDMPPEAVMVFNQSGELPTNLPSSFEVKALDPRYTKGYYKTQKAVELVDKLLEYTTKTGDNVLDPFAGSGTMSIEAIKMGRKTTAIEIDESVVENRIKPGIKEAIENKEDDQILPISGSVKVTTLESYYAFIKRLQNNEIGVEEYQRAFKDFTENKDKIKNELEKQTVDKLLRRAGLHTRKSDGKASIVSSVLDGMEMRFALRRTVSYTLGEGGSKEAVLKLVNETTEADIKKYVEDIAKQQKEYQERIDKLKKAVVSPETLDEFKTFIEINGEEKLTQEQRVKYEELVGLKAKEVEAKKIKDSGVISGVKADTEMTLSETTHSKTGETLYKVSMANRISKEQYVALNTSAKKLGGYYSSYSKGFLFKDKAMAEAFMNVGKGEKVETTRPEEMVEEKKQNVAEKLTDMAERLETMGNEKLNAPRKANTARRANIASGMEADAQNDIAVAKTMKNLARAISSGEAKLLDRVSTKTQIETLNRLLSSANYKQTREDSKQTGTFKTNIPIDLKTVDFVDEFVPTFYVKGLEETIEKSVNTKGLIRSSQKVLESINKAKAQGKEYYIPSVYDMYEIIKVNDGLVKEEVNWQIKENVANFKRLQAMGINSIEQLRATLREYIQFKETAVGPDEVKQLERSVIGKKVGIDFFPTPRNIATQMVEMASIEEGMKVLEPSAGNGNIAEVIREAGVNPDVAEISGDLRSILEAKGFNVVANDFMEVTDKYDRIVMNPPFSNSQDIEHLKHAYELLNEGGKVISIVGEGAFIREGKKETEFRAWLDELGASIEELPAGTFKDGNLLATTGANARLIEIYKPETKKYKLNADPILNLKKDVFVTDIYGNKSTIPQGEALTPYILGGSKILLKDGKEYIVNKNQYQNIKNQSVKAESKEFAPELKKTEETIKGDVEKTFGIPQAMKEFDTGKEIYGIDDEGQESLIENRDDIKNFSQFAFSEDFKPDTSPTKFSQYQLSGGENYKEILIKAPVKKGEISPAKQATLELEKQGITLEPDMDGGVYPIKNGDMVEYDELSKSTQNLLDTAMGNADNASDFKIVQEAMFKSSHWDEPNVIAHLRLNERTYEDKKVTFIEELQSDWAREGRDKGFIKDIKLSATENNGYWDITDQNGNVLSKSSLANTKAQALTEATRELDIGKGIPNNPLLKNWQELSIKRALKEAVDNNSEYLAWTTSEQQSARYNLAKEIKEIYWILAHRSLNTLIATGKPVEKVITIKTQTGGVSIDVGIDNAGVIHKVNGGNSDWVGKNLSDVIGKGISEKILTETNGKLSGEGLNIGGEWAKNLYDRQVKNIVEDLTGGKVEVIDLGLNVESKDPNFIMASGKDVGGRLMKSDLRVGLEIATKEGPNQIITEVLENGKFNGVDAKLFYNFEFEDAGQSAMEQFKKTSTYERRVKTFDITKKKSEGQQAIKLTPEIKAIVRSEVPQLKQPSGAEPIESFKVNGVDNVIFDRTKEEIQVGFKKIFGREIPIETVFNAERDLKNIDALAQAFKSGIRLLEVNKNLSEVVANHEGWHWYKMQLSFTERANITAIEMEYAKQNPEKLKKIKEVYQNQPGYVSEESFAEELMADTLAEYYQTGKTIFQKIKVWFENALMKLKLLFEGRKDVLDMFKNIKKTLDETTGNTKTFGQKLKLEKHPVFNTGDKLTDARLALEYAEKRTGKNGIKARKIPVGNKEVILPPDLTEKIIQVEILEEALEINPMKELKKYEAKSGTFKGELPEVLGKTKEELAGSKHYSKYRQKDVLEFIKQGDVIVEGINMNYGTNMDTEEAREAYEEYKKQEEILKDQKKQVRESIKEFKNKVLDEEALKSLAITEEKKISADIRNAEMRKVLEATQERLKKEEKKVYDRKISIDNAHETPIKKLGYWQQIKQSLNPLSFVDRKTANIFTDWNTKILLSKTLANKESADFGVPFKDGLDVIMKYEAGEETPYSSKIKEKFNSLYEESKARDVDLGFRENYLPHVYMESGEEIGKKIDAYLKDKGMTPEEITAYENGKKLPEEMVKRLKLNPFFSKDRVFKDYKTAMEYGLTPKYTNPDQLVAYYREELERTVANKELIESLIDSAKILPVEEAPNSWVAVNLPFSQKGYYADVRVAKVINGLFENVNDFGFWRNSVKIVRYVSGKMQEIKLSAGLPYSNLNFFSIGQLVKELTSGNLKALNSFFRANFNKASVDWIVSKRPIIDKMARQGINLRDTVDSYERLHKNLVHSPKLMERVETEFNKMFNQKTFNSFMPMLQIQLFEDIYKASMKKGYPEDISLELAGSVVKKNFGITQYNARGDEAEDTLGATFFAPKFREGIINTLYNTGEAGYDFIKNLGGLKAPVNPSLVRNRRLLLGMIITYLLYNMLNRHLNDDDDDENGGENIWENPSNKKFALQIPTEDGTLIYVEFMPSFLSFARNMVGGVISLATGDISTSTQQFGSVFSMPIRTTSEILANKDYFDRPIYKETDSGIDKALKIAKYIGLSVNHPYVTEVVNQLQDKKPLYQSLITGLELPLKFSTKDKVAQGEYYDALDKKAKENAKIKSTVQPVYDKIQKLKLEGKISEATNLYNELNEDQKIVYNRIRESPYETTKVKTEAIDTALNKLNSGEARLNQLEKEIAIAVYGKDFTPAQLTTATKDFAFVRVFGRDDELANSINSAMSNAEKVLLLKKARREMGEEAFREWFKKGRKTVRLESGNDSYVLISDDVRELYIKQKND